MRRALEGGSHHFRQPTLAVHQQLIGRLIASNNRHMHISTHTYVYARTYVLLVLVRTVHHPLSNSHIYPTSVI